MSPPPLLELRQLVKNYGGVRALRGVDFDLRAGEVHALLGENGAGKSTLIKVVTGAHAPNGGTITLAGQTVSGLTPATARALGIACIYQQPALFPDLTVAENLALRLNAPSPAARMRWSDCRARATKLLTRIGAEISPDAEVRSLSMPEQQLVEIACALGSGARIVVMDEPTASLTQKNSTCSSPSSAICAKTASASSTSPTAWKKSSPSPTASPSSATVRASARIPSPASTKPASFA